MKQIRVTIQALQKQPESSTLFICYISLQEFITSAFSFA